MVYVRGFDLRQVPVVLDHYNEHIVASPTLSVFLKDVSNEKNRKTLSLTIGEKRDMISFLAMLTSLTFITKS